MFAIGLHNPLNKINLGHVMRAADAYHARMVAFSGKRIPLDSPTNVSAAQYKVPVIRCDDLHTVIPHGFVPVAVELTSAAKNLVDFVHPHNAFYVFGAEDATLGLKTLSWCRHVVYVPTDICMNLSACVNVVCYDRLAKLGAGK